MNKDQLFNAQLNNTADFEFNRAVANVFDDMVSRSVPFYAEIQRMIAEQAADHAKTGTNVYDLGCATGATLLSMNTSVTENVHFIGIDDSAEMLDKCRLKLSQNHFSHPYHLVTADLNQSLEITNASVVVLCLTLQFVRPIYRDNLLKTIYHGLNAGGALILVEKILAEDGHFNRDFIKYYYRYKRRNHYSDLEIAQKREALENILIPYKTSENLTMVKNAGFNSSEVFFKWYNFTGIIAVKT
jgi:tRNA (cmo5U34)-methyltransferase